MYLLIDLGNSMGDTSVLFVKRWDYNHARGLWVTPAGVITEQERSARRKSWIAIFDTFEELTAARKAGMAQFRAHDAAMTKARKVLRDATNNRADSWRTAMVSSPGASLPKDTL